MLKLLTFRDSVKVLQLCNCVVINVNIIHMNLAYCNKYSLKVSFKLHMGNFALTELSILSCVWGSVLCKHFQCLRMNLQVWVSTLCQYIGF